jgi:hypothetical protein
MSPEDRDLLHRHLNGDLRGAELEAFFAKLKESPELRRELASFATDEALLSEVVLENRHRAPKRRTAWKAWVPAAAAAALLLVGLVWLLAVPSTSFCGTVHSATPETRLLRQGSWITVERGTALRDGDKLVGTAHLALRSGGLALSSASIQLGDAGARLNLERGWLQGDGNLPKIVTRIGTLLPGRGSSLEASFENGRLRTAVYSGSARIERGGAVTEVLAGTFALIGSTVETGRSVPRGSLGEAIGRAQAFLVKRRTDLTRSLRDGKRHAEAPPRTYAELAVLALPGGDPLVEDMLDALLGKRIESTYTAALQAVALNRVDPVRHRERIRSCYRFLVENQCVNGQWDYGEAQPQLRPSGDNSCSTYAALGLRACREAGIEVDREVVRRSRDWWLQAQNADGGWGYNEYGNRELEAAPAGHTASNASYGSATASGISSIQVLSTILGEDYSRHASVRRGLEWLAKNHVLDRNPRKAPGFSQIHYWLALERLGLGLGTEHVGTHEWYADGAEFLLRTQQADGSWKVEQGDFMGREIGDVLDTCLAVIYLRRVPFSREEQW